MIIMNDPVAQRERAIQFSDQVKVNLNAEFGSTIDWESDSSPSLQFLIKTNKSYEMRLEYNTTDDSFVLYDRDAKTQRNETLGNFSPANITTPGDATSSDIARVVKGYAV